MHPVLVKLKLIATICFTQKFIDEIYQMQYENKQRELKEQEEEGYDKF